MRKQPEKKYSFDSDKVLASWLRDTTEGRAIWEAAGRTKVLVVIDSGGWVEVYARDNVEVLVVNSPRDVWEGPKLAEHDQSVREWLTVLLPGRFRKIFQPICKVAVGFWSLMSLQEIVRRKKEDKA